LLVAKSEIIKKRWWRFKSYCKLLLVIE